MRAENERPRDRRELHAREPRNNEPSLLEQLRSASEQPVVARMRAQDAADEANAAPPRAPTSLWRRPRHRRRAGARILDVVPADSAEDRDFISRHRPVTTSATRGGARSA